jgi:hypothetical protein
MVQLEEPHARGAEPQRAVVVASAAYHYLGHTCRDSLKDLFVKEACASNYPWPKPSRRTWSHACAQLVLSFWVALWSVWTVKLGTD